MSFGIFQFRRGTAAQATAANIVLLDGELGLETDTRLFKIGDGVTPWNSLPYGGLVGPQGLQGNQGAQGNDGWEPVLAAETDGQRRVLRLVDWIGGGGTKPTVPVNSYIGPTGFTNLAGATDIRGATGATGPQGAPAIAFRSVTGNTGTATAEVADDSLAITGGTGISTAATDTPDGLVITNTDTGSAARTAHEAAADPHPQYTTTAEAAAAAPVQSVAAGTGISVNATTGNVTVTNSDRGSTAVARHEGLADPHPQYTTTAEAAAAAPVQSVNGQTGNVTINVPPLPLAAKTTNLFASTANSTAVQTVLTLNVPAGYLTAGKIFNIRLDGTQSQSAAATNVVVAIFVNGTQVVSAAVAGGTAAQTNRSIRAEGSILYNGSVFYGNITTGISGVLPVGNANVAGVAANAANPVTIEIRVQTSTANAANIIRAASAFIMEV